MTKNNNSHKELTRYLKIIIAARAKAVNCATFDW